jgi:hypothetical protein
MKYFALLGTLATVATALPSAQQPGGASLGGALTGSDPEQRKLREEQGREYYEVRKEVSNKKLNS